MGYKSAIETIESAKNSLKGSNLENTYKVIKEAKAVLKVLNSKKIIKMNVSKWILKNKPLYDINIGDDLNDILKKINTKNYYLVGERNYGYYYNKNGYRFGFSDSIIDEIGVDLLQIKGEVIIEKGKSKIDLKTAKIHKVLSFFNDLNIRWIPVPISDIETLAIKLEDSKIFFFFDIYEGVLEKISKSNILLPLLRESSRVVKAK